MIKENIWVTITIGMYTKGGCNAWVKCLWRKIFNFYKQEE